LQAQQKIATEPEAVSQEDVELAREQHKALQAALKSKQSVVDTFDNTGVAACPVCHTPTAQLASYLEECRAAVTQLVQDEKAAATRLARVLTKHSAYNQWAAKQREFEIAGAGLREQEQRLEHVTPPATSESALSQIVEDYAEYQNALKEIEPVLQKTRAHKSKLDGVLATLQEQHAQLLAQISANKTTAADFDLATAKIAKLSADASQRHKLEQEHAQLLFEKMRLEELVHKTKHDEATAAVLLRWLESSALVREAFKTAPRLVAQRNLQKLEAYVNDILQIFGVDFTVSTSDDNGPNFIANFADGRKQTAQRLSFGQKTVLAVAFRVAVVSLFSADAGFLALDEPTVYMNQPAVQSFSAVLEKLREVSAASGLQCLIITHETGLSHAFESLIEIPSTLARA
jgi:chromosome segregation ATPase